MTEQRLHQAHLLAARALFTLLSLSTGCGTDLTGQQMARKNERWSGVLAGDPGGPWSTMWAHSGLLKLNLPFVRPVFLLYGYHPGSVISLVDLLR